MEEHTGIRYNNRNINFATSSVGLTDKRSNFPYVFDKEEHSALGILKEQKSILYAHNLHISSADRDTTNYPLHYNYRIHFEEIKNVKKVELISAIFPNQPASSSGGDILNEPYLTLDIQELNCIEFGEVASNKSFSILPLKTPNKSSGGFINTETCCMDKTSKVFKTSRNLSVLTIQIKDMSGNLYDFGQPTGSTAKAYQNAFTFKIINEEPTGSKARNIY